jgi:hypothetical protein
MCAEQSYQSPVSESRRVDLVELRRRLEVDPARGHERERSLDLRREPLVLPPLRRARDEVLVPRVHLRQVCEPALRERAHEVERRRRVVEALEHPLRVGHARGRRRCVVVDHVAAEDRDLAVGRLLGRRRARLHELPRDPADLEHGQRRAVGQHGRHLQQDLQPLPDRNRRVRGARLGDAPVVVERLGAVARLEEERAPCRDLAERGANLARLAGEDERRQRVQRPLHLGDGGLVGPLRLLARGPSAPRRRRPGGVEHGHEGSVGVGARR